MVFAIEGIIACVLFTIALEILAARRRDVFVNDYPPIVTNRLRDLHMAADILMAPFQNYLYDTYTTASENVSEAVSMSGQNPENSMSV